MEKLIASAAENLTTLGLRLAGAAIAVAVGLKVVNVILKLVTRSKGFLRLEEGLRSFIKSILKIIMYVLLFFTAAAILGIPMTSFLTVLASAGLAVGLALQGSLSNFAGGIMILFFKPFVVGDFVEVGTNSGTVKAINAFYTVLTTPDNKIITIPNGVIANSDMINYSGQTTRRVDLTFSVSYSSDISAVKTILLGAAVENKKVLSSPEPFAGLQQQSASSLDFILRVWCEKDEYWNVYYELNERVKELFDENKIEIPFPQLDVHMDTKQF